MAHTTRLLVPALAILTLGAAAGLWLAPADAPVPAAPATLRDGPAAAAAASASASATGGGRERAAADLGCYGARPGATFRHRLVDTVDLAVLSPEGGARQTARLHAECVVATTVLDRREAAVLVRQQLEDLRCLDAHGRPIADDPVAAAFTAAAAAPVLVALGADGRVQGYGFADGLNGDQRNFLRGTLGLLAFPAPGAAATTWSGEEADTTGRFAADYAVLPAAAGEVAVQRTKTGYLLVAGHAALPEHRVGGRAVATFATGLGWLANLQLDETLAMALPVLDLRTEARRRASVALVASGATADLGDVAAAWAAATAPATGAAETTGAFAAEQEQRQWRERLRGVDCGRLLGEVEKLLAAEPLDREALDAVFQQLLWLARLDAGAAQQLAAAVTNRTASADAAAVLVGALGAAGTPAAQQALVAVRGDRTLPEPVRRAAAASALQLAEPGAELLEGLAADALGEAPERDTAMLALGALAARSDQPLASGRTALATLLAMEDAAAARGELATWVLAAGNTRSPAAIDAAARHLEHGDAAVRAAACVALRSRPGAEPLLAQRALQDGEPAVRREAIAELGRRGTPAACAALEQVVQQESSEELRRVAQELLGRR